MLYNINLSITSTLLVAVIVLLIGRALQHKIKFLEKFFIPAPVIGGMIFSIVVTISHCTKICEISFDTTLSEVFMLVFFSTVGFSATLKFLKKEGKIVFLFLLCAVGLVILQNILGVSIALLMNKSFAFGMATASIPMTGGHGTAAAFGPILDKHFGIANASTISIAAATAGLFMGSLIGGPLGRKLMDKYKLKPEIEFEKAVMDEDNHKILMEDKEMKITEHGIFNSVFAISFAIGIGAFVSYALTCVGLIMPGYIGAMFIAAVIRNFADSTKIFKIHSNEMEVLGNISLSLFLVMALMNMQLWVLSNLALPIVVLIGAQVILMYFFAYFVTFRVLGKNYDAAVMACGHCGFGLGATPNAVANMEAFTALNYPSPQAFFVLPLVGALFIDFINSGVITVFLNIF
jgi:glutamate:Na+ symporter, ESS family